MTPRDVAWKYPEVVIPLEIKQIRKEMRVGEIASVVVTSVIIWPTMIWNVKCEKDANISKICTSRR